MLHHGPSQRDLLLADLDRKRDELADARTWLDRATAARDRAAAATAAAADEMGRAEATMELIELQINDGLDGLNKIPKPRDP